MMPSIPRLLLHAGIHKTGTTTLQVALEALRAQLRANGVALVTIGQMKRLDHEAAWARRRSNPLDMPKFVKEFRSLVYDEMNAVEASWGRPAEQVLISNERMVGARMPSEADRPLFRPLAVSSISRLMDTLEPSETKIAFYTRRQDRLMESCYLWEVQKGLSHSVRTQFPFLDEPVLRYSELIERLLAIPGVGSIRVRPFETIRSGSLAYLDDFLSNLGLQGRLDFSTFEEDPSANRSYTQPALEIALKVNQHLETSKQRDAFRKFLKALFPVDAYPAATVFTDEQRRHLIDLYRSDNEVLFTTWMPDLPFDAYSTLDGAARLGVTRLLDTSG